MPMYRGHRDSPSNRIEKSAMCAETQTIIDDIKQGITLLRRHL